MAFRVADIDAIVARLKSSGITFVSDTQLVPDSQVTYAGGVRKRLVYFHDPEGNLLELCEYRS
jgi:catechol 2,3-dioxygenase-like lactoylglutathione lyase family enzyme